MEEKRDKQIQGWKLSASAMWVACRRKRCFMGSRSLHLAWELGPEGRHLGERRSGVPGSAHIHPVRPEQPSHSWATMGVVPAWVPTLTFSVWEEYDLCLTSKSHRLCFLWPRLSWNYSMEGILIIQFLLSKIDMAPTCHTDDQFNLVFPRDSLTLPWTARRSNQSILKDINPK